MKIPSLCLCVALNCQNVGWSEEGEASGNATSKKWGEDTDRRKRRMVNRQGWRLLFPLWDCGGRNAGSEAQWRSTAYWHTRTGERPCVCVCTSCHFWWMLLTDVAYTCYNYSMLYSSAMLVSDLFALQSSQVESGLKKLGRSCCIWWIWWRIILKRISSMSPTLKLWCDRLLEDCPVHFLGNIFLWINLVHSRCHVNRWFSNYWEIWSCSLFK